MFDDVWYWLVRHAPFLGDAAWIQAIGSLLAIFVVLVGGWRQTRRERLERKTRAGAMAVVLYPEILELKAKIAGALKSVRGTLQHATMWQHVNSPQLLVNIPPAIEESWDRHHELGGKAGVTVSQLLGLLRQYNRLVTQGAASHGSLNPPAVRQALMHYETHLKGPEALVQDALELVGRIHDRHVAPTLGLWYRLFTRTRAIDGN